MSKVDVLQMLGEPLSKDAVKGKDYDQVWRYTDGPADTSWWFRVVLFNKADQVVRTEAKYFVD